VFLNQLYLTLEYESRLGIFKINLHTQTPRKQLMNDDRNTQNQELQCTTSSTTFQLRELNLDFGMQQIQNNFPQLYRYVTALTSLFGSTSICDQQF
jgi:hypothetical protein